MTVEETSKLLTMLSLLYVQIDPQVPLALARASPTSTPSQCGENTCAVTRLVPWLSYPFATPAHAPCLISVCARPCLAVRWPRYSGAPRTWRPTSTGCSSTSRSKQQTHPAPPPPFCVLSSPRLMTASRGRARCSRSPRPSPPSSTTGSRRPLSAFCAPPRSCWCGTTAYCSGGRSR